jgi:hypothetical protein
MRKWLVLIIVIGQSAWVAAQAFNLCPALLELGWREGLEGTIFIERDLKTSLNIQPSVLGGFKQITETMKTQGISLVLVPVPWRGVPLANFLDSEDEVQATFDVAKAKDVYRMAIATLQESSGATVIDVLAVMETAPTDAATPLFYKRDHHWTYVGSSLVAHALAERVKTELSDLYASLPKRTTELISKELVRETRTMEQAKELCNLELPPEPSLIFEAKSNQEETSLFGEEASQVVLVGSSQSAPNQSFPAFLAHELQTDILNLSVAGGGLVGSLESYLTSDTYANSKPHLIIWEFPVEYLLANAGAVRSLWPGFYGDCQDTPMLSQESVIDQTTLSVLATAGNAPTVHNNSHYLVLHFSDLSITQFKINFVYQDGATDTVSVARESRQTPNTGVFFMGLSAPTEAILKDVRLELAEGATGTLTTRLCRVPF